jgi:hypothetical protein
MGSFAHASITDRVVGGNAHRVAARSSAMHLVLGHPDDYCCAGVLARFLERGFPARLVTDPLAVPARFVWRLDNAGMETRLALDGTSPTTVSSVLVRDVGWLQTDGWDPSDHAYMQAETRAALLAWLESLPCPVINRTSAAIWYRHRLPLLAWLPLLRGAGLPTPEIVLTNDAADARNFGLQLEDEGAGGALCTPLTTDAAWLVTASDWTGLAKLQELAPVCLSEPHGPAQSACIVGDRILWDRDPSSEVAGLAPNLLRFARTAGLTLLEVAVAAGRRGPFVAVVEPHVRFDHFRARTRELILDALVDVLTGETAQVREVEEASP